MRKSLIAPLLLATGMTAAVWAVEPKYNATDRFPPGVSAKVLDDQNDIRSILAEVSNTALSKGSMDDLVERIATPDRKRFGTFFDSDSAEVDGRIEQIQKAWKAKYGVDLNINDRKLFDGFVTINEGEITDEAAVRSSWPISASKRGDWNQRGADMSDPRRGDRDLSIAERAELDRMTPEKRAEWQRLDREKSERDIILAERAERDRLTPEKRREWERSVREKAERDLTSAERADRDRLTPEKRADWERTAIERAERDRNNAPNQAEMERLASGRMSPDRAPSVSTPETIEYLKNGRNVAIVHVGPGHNMPPVTVSMIRERIDSWRIDLPDDMTAQRLSDNLKTALTDIGEKSAAWPADVNDAYRMVGHRLLLAIYDVPATSYHNLGNATPNDQRRDAAR